MEWHFIRSISIFLILLRLEYLRFFGTGSPPPPLITIELYKITCIRRTDSYLLHHFFQMRFYFVHSYCASPYYIAVSQPIAGIFGCRIENIVFCWHQIAVFDLALQFYYPIFPSISHFRQWQCVLLPSLLIYLMFQYIANMQDMRASISNACVT